MTKTFDAKQYARDYYQTHKEKHKARTKKWKLDNKEHVKEYLSKYNQSRIQKYDLVDNMLRSSKIRSSRKGLDFDLTREDIVIPEKCLYLNVPLVVDRSGGHYVPSLDRIDPNKGYVKGNIQVISLLANRMKQDATPEQQLLFAQGVLKLYGGNGDI